MSYPIIILFGLILLVVVIWVMVNKNNTNNKKEAFKIGTKLEDDGKMRFGYLTNYGYANSILSRYYINDDKKIGGVRLVSHPYQIRYSPNGRDKYFGDLYWDKTKSDNVYKTNGVRL
jgi:hypothetical protein